MSLDCWFAQGQTNSAISVMTSSTGQEKANSGRRKPASPWPLVNQTTISLSWYMRDKVLTMAAKSDSVSRVGMRPSAE